MFREMIEFVAIALGSIPIIWWSRHSLIHPASHGFPRCIAFEAILSLVVVNARYWFVQPFGYRQLLAWLLLLISLVLVVWAVILLRRQGRSGPVAAGSPLFQWENTGNLVMTGIYRYIRHPMYASLLFLAWGTLLKSVSVPALVLAVIASLALATTARFEESENLLRFGTAYREYMSRTRRFIPFVL